jgi:small subunit ribosomal protein S17
MKKGVRGFSDVERPENQCQSPKCPFHGTLSIRRRIKTAVLFSAKMQAAGVLMNERTVFVPKYRRYKKVTKKLSARIPTCLRDLSIGDRVFYGECRNLSKTISHVVLGKVSNRTESKE